MNPINFNDLPGDIKSMIFKINRDREHREQHLEQITHFDRESAGFVSPIFAAALYDDEHGCFIYNGEVFETAFSENIARPNDCIISQRQGMVSQRQGLVY